MPGPYLSARFFYAAFFTAFFFQAPLTNRATKHIMRQIQSTTMAYQTPTAPMPICTQSTQLRPMRQTSIEVTRPTPKDIHDIFEIRGIMEPAILRQCCGMVDPQWAVDMRALLQGHADDTASNAGETAAPLIDLDNRFHLELVDVFHNQYASNLMRSLVDFLNLIRVTAWRADRYQISNREHIDILDAILEKDVDRACRLMEEHIQLSYQEAIHTMMHASF